MSLPTQQKIITPPKLWASDILTKNVEEIEKLLRDDADPTVEDAEGSSALFIALYYDKEKILDMMIPVLDKNKEWLADKKNVTDSLLEAIKGGSIKGTMYFLGKNPNLAAKKDYDSFIQAVEESFRYGKMNEKLFEVIVPSLHEADVKTYEQRLAKQAEHRQSRENVATTFKEFLDKIPENERNKYIESNKKLFEELALQDPTAALPYAVMLGDSSIVEKLLKENADPNTIHTVSGKDVLKIATEGKNPNIINLIKSYIDKREKIFESLKSLPIPRRPKQNVEVYFSGWGPPGGQLPHVTEPLRMEMEEAPPPIQYKKPNINYDPNATNPNGIYHFTWELMYGNKNTIKEFLQKPGLTKETIRASVKQYVEKLEKEGKLPPLSKKATLPFYVLAGALLGVILGVAIAMTFTPIIAAIAAGAFLKALALGFAFVLPSTLIGGIIGGVIESIVPQSLRNPDEHNKKEKETFDMINKLKEEIKKESTKESVEKPLPKPTLWERVVKPFRPHPSISSPKPTGAIPHAQKEETKPRPTKG